MGDERGGKGGEGDERWGGGKIRVNLTISEEEERRREEGGERGREGEGEGEEEVCVGGHEPEMVKFFGDMRERKHPDEGWEREGEGQVGEGGKGLVAMIGW